MRTGWRLDEPITADGHLEELVVDNAVGCGIKYRTRTIYIGPTLPPGSPQELSALEKLTLGVAGLPLILAPMGEPNPPSGHISLSHQLPREPMGSKLIKHERIPVMRLDQVLRGYVSPALSPLGFKKSGKTYRLANEQGDQVLINFQTSQAAGLDDIVFFVNIAVVPSTQHEVMSRHFGRAANVQPSIAEGILTDRVWPDPDVEHDNRSEFRDQRWEFTDTATAEACGRRLARVLSEDVAPALSRLLDRRALLQYLRQPESASRWKTKRLPRNVVVLLIDEGPSQELNDAIAKAAAVGDINTVQWAEERLRTPSGPTGSSAI